MSEEDVSPLFAWRQAIAKSPDPKAGGLTPTERLVAFMLSMFMTAERTRAWPGPARLARMTGHHISTVKAALKGLVQKGWLGIVTKGGSAPDGVRVTTEYQALFPNRGLEAPGAQDDRGSRPRRPGVETAPTGGTGRHKEEKKTLMKTRAESTELSPGQFAAQFPDVRFASTIYDRAIADGRDHDYAAAAAAAFDERAAS